MCCTYNPTFRDALSMEIDGGRRPSSEGENDPISWMDDPRFGLNARTNRPGVGDRRSGQDGRNKGTRATESEYRMGNAMDDVCRM